MVKRAYIAIVASLFLSLISVPAQSASVTAAPVAKAKAPCVYNASGKLVCGRYRQPARVPAQCNCPRDRYYVTGYRVWPYYSYRRYYDLPFNYYRTAYRYQPYAYYQTEYWYDSYHPGTFSMQYDYPFREYQIPYYRNPW